MKKREKANWIVVEYRFGLSIINSKTIPRGKQFRLIENQRVTWKGKISSVKSFSKGWNDLKNGLNDLKNSISTAASQVNCVKKFNVNDLNNFKSKTEWQYRDNIYSCLINVRKEAYSFYFHNL